MKAFPEWRMNKKFDQDGRLLGLSRRLVTENIASKLSENLLLRQDPSTELGRRTD